MLEVIGQLTNSAFIYNYYQNYLFVRVNQVLLITYIFSKFNKLTEHENVSINQGEHSFLSISVKQLSGQFFGHPTQMIRGLHTIDIQRKY